MQLVAGGWLISVCIDSFESGWLSSSEGELALIADGEATAVQLLAVGWLVAGMTMACLDVQSSVVTGSSCWLPSSVGGSTSVILATAGGPVYSVLLSV